MKILSITLSHNASVGYFENDELVYFLHEEKFDNIKNSDYFPMGCLKYISSKFDIKDIAKIAISGEYLYEHFLKIDKNNSNNNLKDIKVDTKEKFLYMLSKHFPDQMLYIYDLIGKKGKYKYIDKLLKLLSDYLGYKITKDKLHFVNHHLCHALSPIYFYGLYQLDEPVLIFTLDGLGDNDCATVNIWDKGQIRVISKTSYFNSLGYLWSSLTKALGMKPLEHEYKVMGLAAYTSNKYFQKIYDELFKDLIWVDGLEFKSKIPLNRSHVYFYNKLYGKRFDNIAGALQFTTEKLVCEWIKNGVEKTGINKLAFSGGVFMNVKLNKVIQELPFLEKVYFMPSCGDESNVVGAIFNTYMQYGGDLGKLKPVKTMYKGIDFDDAELENFIDKNIKGKYKVEKLQDDETSAKIVAKLLSNFEVVAVVRGKGEWGARSLCNRAILANASNLKSFHIVNDMIKMRDFWMPFAPAILEEFAHIYIKDWDKLKSKTIDSSYYMITAYDTTEKAQIDLVAAMHQKDKTIRPQLVNQNTNLWMYKVLKNYESLTGMGGILNTSLNIHGYPLVGTLEQALFTFENSGLKYILIGNFLISKNG